MSTTLNLMVGSTDTQVNGAFHLKFTMTTVKQRECYTLETMEQETHRRKTINANKKDI